jgi:nucleotide-binding universal stress UspA family protein
VSTCILCGIDGSREAGRAAAVGARLARDLDARALLVHVDEDARTRPSGVRWPAPSRAWRKRRLLKATAAECCFPRGTKLRLEKGDPTAALLTLAQDEDAELVVVSTGGRGTASPVLLGGTASALMRRCPCPVVVVPTTSVVPLDADSMRDVVCAVEGRPSDVPVIGLAADLARRLGAELHVVVSSESGARRDESTESRSAIVLEGAGVEAHTHALALPIDDAVEQVASDERAVLAVVGPPESGEPGSVLNGLVAIRLAAAGSTALVVLPSKAELQLGSGHYELAGAH